MKMIKFPLFLSWRYFFFITPCINTNLRINDFTFLQNDSCSEDGCCGGSSKSEPNREEEESRSPKPSDFTFFASNSTLHGLTHIFPGGRVTVRRLFWAVAFFSSLSLFLYQVKPNICISIVPYNLAFINNT